MAKRPGEESVDSSETMTASAAKKPKEYTCRRCKQTFWMGDAEQRDSALRPQNACRYHPEAFSGETEQKWSEPVGDQRAQPKPGRKLGDMASYWHCCGRESIEAEGCRASFHITFDEEDDLVWGH